MFASTLTHIVDLCRRYETQAVHHGAAIVGASHDTGLP